MKTCGRPLLASLLSAGLAGGLLVTGAGPAVGAAAGSITTVAGGPGLGLASHVFQVPEDVATGPDGAVYVGDANGIVRQLSTSSDTEGVTAGVRVPGHSGDGGPATRAEIGFISSLTRDSSGSMLLDTVYNQQVRVIAGRTGTFWGQAMTAGDIYTVAGNGHLGASGNGGPATAAELGYPEGVAEDAAGNLIISDSFNSEIQVVADHTGTFYGQAMTAGDIYRVVGTGQWGFSGDGGPAIDAQLDEPSSVVVDAAGNLLIADSVDNRIRVVAATTGTFYGQAMTAGDIYSICQCGSETLTVDSAGNVIFTNIGTPVVQVLAESSGVFYGVAMTAGHVYAVAGDGTKGAKGDGGPAIDAELGYAAGTAVDGAGNLVIADSLDDLVRVVASTTGTFYGQAMKAGDIYTVAGNNPYGSSGNGGRAVDAEFANPAYPNGTYPDGVAVTPGGNYAVSDETQVRLVARTSGTFFGQAMKAGNIYAVAGRGINGYSGDGGPALAARIKEPGGLAVDAAGNLVFADTGNERIRVVAARSGTFYGQAMTAGDVYTLAGNGTESYSGDGGPATAAELSRPGDVAVDAAGNLAIADSGNSRIRVVAARSGTFYGQAMTAGDIYTVAGNGQYGFAGDGGPAAQAELAGPGGVAVDAAGDLVIADSGNNRIRVVAATTGTFYGQAMTAGDIYTVAGNGQAVYHGNGSPASSASVNEPLGVAVDAAGNLVIADTGNNRIRVIAARSGTFYGRAMIAGDIYNVAGNGHGLYAGDGGRAVYAGLDYPEKVAVDAAGDLVIADTGNCRLRLVTE
jgi:trimeric autotransporter adhesin